MFQEGVFPDPTVWQVFTPLGHFMHQILPGGGYTPTREAGMPYGPSWSLGALIMAKNCKAIFGDLHEKKKLSLLNFLEKIQGKHRASRTNQNWISSRFLRVELPEVARTPRTVHWVSPRVLYLVGSVSGHCPNQVGAFPISR